MAVKERLIEFVEFKRLSKSEFCRRIGTSNAFITSIRKSIQPDKIESISNSFPELSIAWLLTGEGDMLNSDSQPLPSNEDNVSMSREVFDLLKNLSETVLSQQKTIEVLSTNGKAVARVEDDAGCADVNDLRLAK